MEERYQQMQGQMMKHVPGLLDRWHNEYEPEVRSINDEVLGAELPSLSDRELAELLAKLVDQRERSGHLHFLAVFPAMGAAMAYDEAYQNFVGQPQADDHLQLLQGFPTRAQSRTRRCGVSALRRGAVRRSWQR
jgi:hypothetical protein